MTRELKDIQSTAEALRSLFAERNKNLEEMRKMFHLEWSTSANDDLTKRTMSPAPFNDVIGAVRLMSATEPEFSVPFDEGNTASQLASEKLEQAAKAMWKASGRVALRSVHNEVAFSAVLFGEVYVSVTRTADLVKAAKKPGQKARALAIEKQTPYLYKVHNPATCYPLIDGLGLAGMLRRVSTTWGEVVDTFGEAAENVQPGNLSKKEPRLDVVTLNTWQDWDTEAIWLDESSDAIVLKDNVLGFIPMVAGIADGSFLFDRPELQRLPLLYALMKSGLWKRQNLALTTVFSTIAALGSNPQLVLYSDDDQRVLFIDRSIPGGILRLRKGEQIGALNDKVFEPAQMTALDVAQRLGRESTISQSALGGAPDRVMSFSEMSLLAQAGRLPLVGPKEVGGEAIGQATVIALKWLKASGQAAHLEYGQGRAAKAIDLEPGEIPETVRIDATLEVNLPQDKMSQIASANQATGSKLVSKRWARENLLGVGQSAQMDREVVFELLDEFAVQRAIEMLKQRDQAALQPAPAGEGAPPTTPTPNPPPSATGEGADAGMSADMANMMQGLPPGGQVGPGMPMQGPQLPPNQMPPRWR